MKKIILVLAIAAALPTHAQQGTKVNKGSIGLGFHLACPQSELKDIKYDDGFGINLSYLTRKYPYKSMVNFQLGVQLDFANMQSKTFKDIELSDPDIKGFGTNKAINNMYGTFGVARINFGTDDDKVVPYINLLAGHRNYSTRQHFSLDNPAANPEYQSDTTTMRVVHTNRFHYGAGVGVNYRINEYFSLESSVTYTIGGTGAALPLKNITKAEGSSTVDYSNYKSVRTDMLLINVGLRIHLYERDSDRNSTPSSTLSNSPTNTRYKDTPRNTPTNTTPKNGTPTTPAKKKVITPKKNGPVKGGKDKS
jgi:hypothetical protein